MAFIQDYEQTVQASPTNRPQTFVNLSQNENGRQLIFHIIGVSIPAGSIATLSGTKPDGVVYSTTGTIEGDFVTVSEDMQMTAVAGVWDAKIHIVNGGNEIASALVRFVVEKDPVDAGAIPSDSQLDGIVAECQAYAEAARSSAYGSPLTASTAAAMTDQTRVYVYTGSETGYTAGHWYYYDGSAWTDGGAYNSAAIQTDPTLAIPGMAADSKAVGDAIAAEAAARAADIDDVKADLRERINDLSLEIGDVDISITPVEVVMPAYTHNARGVIFTQSSDGKIHAQGTNSSQTARAIYVVSDTNDNKIPIQLYAGKKYRLTGCPVDGAVNGYTVDLRFDVGGGIYIDNGEGVTFTLQEDGIYNIAIAVAAGVTINETFEPKIEEISSLPLSDQISELSSSKLDKILDAEYAGKILCVDTDGSIIPMEYSKSLTDDAKVILMNCMRHVLWKDANGPGYCDALAEALGLTN